NSTGTITAPGTTASTSAATNENKSNMNAIIGGVIGGVAFLALVALAFIYLRRRRLNHGNALGFNKDRMVKGAPDAGIDYTSPRSSFASMTGDTEKPLRKKDGR
ncbi:hypothetical protein VNI00_017306, partial [Paramarasmius palmivorus]